eukprot:6193833-Pleurochrysis_carterae.AAC.2
MTRRGQVRSAVACSATRRSVSRLHMLGLLLLVLCSAPTAGWTTISAANFGTTLKTTQEQMAGVCEECQRDPMRGLGYIWTFPESPNDDTGLGGGITYALDPKLCDDMLPRFMEDIWFIPFLNCGDLEDAFTRHVCISAIAAYSQAVRRYVRLLCWPWAYAFALSKDDHRSCVALC